MRHMNPKLVKLLYEGFSIKTLENLSEKQLVSLYHKIMEQEMLNVKKGSPGEAEAKSSGKSFVTYEKELEEDDFALNRMSGNDPYETGDNYSGPGSDDGFGDEYDGMPTEAELEEKSISKKQRVASMTKKQLKYFSKPKTSTPPKKVKSNDVKNLEESILKIIEKHIPPHFTKGEILKNYRIRI